MCLFHSVRTASSGLFFESFICCITDIADLSSDCYLLLLSCSSSLPHAENWVFESEAPDANLKLIDFGLSRHFSKNEVMHVPVGTPYTIGESFVSIIKVSGSTMRSASTAAEHILLHVP